MRLGCLCFNKTLYIVTVFPLACRFKRFGSYVAQCYLVLQFLSSCCPFARRLDSRRSLGPPREETAGHESGLSLQLVTRTLKGNEKQFELVRNSSYRSKFHWHFDQGKQNLVRVSGELELSRNFAPFYPKC